MRNLRRLVKVWAVFLMKKDDQNWWSFHSLPPLLPLIFFPVVPSFEVVDWSKRRLEERHQIDYLRSWSCRLPVSSRQAVVSIDGAVSKQSRAISFSLFLSLSRLFLFFLYILFQINFFVERVSWQPNTLEVSCMLSIGLLAERIGRWPVGWVAGRMDVAML